MEVRIKKTNSTAIIPSYAKNGDAGLDLSCISIRTGDGFIEYDTGIALEINEGFVGLLYPRSSISKYDLILTNSVGVIDSGFRGSVKFRFKQTGNKIYQLGDKIGQLIIMPYPLIQLKEVDELSNTERGTGGFGHSGV
jgi:dUTP pyrophosphatase